MRFPVPQLPPPTPTHHQHHLHITQTTPYIHPLPHTAQARYFLKNWPVDHVFSIREHCTFPHHYQGRIDFNTVNPFHSTRMDLVSIPAGRAVMANPVPRDRIFHYSPCRGLNTHPRAMNMQLAVQCWWGIQSASLSRQAKVVSLVIAYTILTKTISKYQSNYVWKNIWGVIDISIWHASLQKWKILACNFQMYG